AKYFDPEAGGRPRGLRRPTEMRTEMSFSAKPRNQAVSVIVRRAGGLAKERKSRFSWFMPRLRGLQLAIARCWVFPSSVEAADADFDTCADWASKAAPAFRQPEPAV